jgi:hypothetical protein
MSHCAPSRYVCRIIQILPPSTSRHAKTEDVDPPVRKIEKIGIEERRHDTRDIGTVMRHVYFDAVRISLTNQIVDAYTRRTGIQISPFARSFASAGLIAHPVVQKLISPTH